MAMNSPVSPPGDAPEEVQVPPPPPTPSGVTRPGKRGLQERPEKGFESRRRRLLLGLGLIVTVGALLICNRCQQPVDVAPMFATGSKPSTGLLGAQPAAAADVTQTPESLKVAFPAPGAPTATTVPSPVIVGGAITCYASKDIPLPSAGGTIPALAMVRVTGYTSARGGLAQVGGDWVSVGWLRCDGDLTYLERPFMIEATPTRARPGSVNPNLPVDSGGVIVITATPAPSLVPSPTPINGIWWVGPNCWVINAQGVSQIWVDGKGVSTGTYCGVKEMRIVVASP